MPEYKIETTAQVRRIYFIKAATEDEAEQILNETGDNFMSGEEDISEEVDDISEVTPEPTTEKSAI